MTGRPIDWQIEWLIGCHWLIDWFFTPTGRSICNLQIDQEYLFISWSLKNNQEIYQNLSTSSILAEVITSTAAISWLWPPCWTIVTQHGSLLSFPASACNTRPWVVGAWLSKSSLKKDIQYHFNCHSDWTISLVKQTVSKYFPVSK